MKHWGPLATNDWKLSLPGCGFLQIIVILVVIQGDIFHHLVHVFQHIIDGHLVWTFASSNLFALSLLLVPIVVVIFVGVEVDEVDDAALGLVRGRFIGDGGPVLGRVVVVVDLVVAVVVVVLVSGVVTVVIVLQRRRRLLRLRLRRRRCRRGR